MNNREFFLNNYSQIVKVGLVGKEIILGDKDDKVCRFCGRTPNETSFNHRAHAIPEFLGNKKIFSNYECDECNNDFSLLERELGIYTLPFRSLTQVYGKQSVPNYPNDDLGIHIHQENDGVHITFDEKNPPFKIDEKKNTVELNLGSVRFTPILAFKALVKVVISLLPNKQVEYVSDTIQWLRLGKEKSNNFNDKENCIVIESFIPGYNPIIKPHVLVLKKNDENLKAPSMIGYVAFSNLGFQFSVPYCSLDYKFANELLKMPTIPISYKETLDGKVEKGNATYRTVDFTNYKKIKSEPRIIEIKYSNLNRK